MPSAPRIRAACASSSRSKSAPPGCPASLRREGWTGYDAGPYEDIDFDRLDMAFRNHYQEHYVGAGLPYTNYTPAYRFGYHLTLHDQFREGDWDLIEPEARRLWVAERDEPWEEYRDAVAYGWERSRTRYA